MGIPLGPIPLEGIPLEGIPLAERAACAPTALHSTRPQHAAPMYAVTVALKKRAERRVVRRVCVVMLGSFDRISMYAYEVITFQPAVFLPMKVSC